MTTKIATTNIQDSALTTLLGPKVTTIVYPGDDTATDTAGGQTINLTGSGFQSGSSVLVGSTAASVVSFISSTQISFTAPVQTAGTYVLYVINPDGGTAISIPGISYSGTPNWTTTAGSLGTAYEAGAISATLTATGDAPITYTLVSGTLPTGSTLNSNGTLSGTAPATASATTYSFTIKATDAQNQDTNRAFSITINPDVVTWSTPADSTTYSVFKDSAIANVAMSATSASGGSITYTADTLPTGLSITGANIAGTPTVAASTTTTLTATATSTRSATRTINWVVSIANDTFFKNVTLLLNSETTVTPFISDASTNSFGLTIVGDTKPTLFNPYTPGYYSNYFDGTGDYLSAPSNSAFAFGTGDFTLECWIYVSSPSDTPIYEGRTSGDSSLGFTLTAFSSTVIRIFCGSVLISATVANYTNQWTHVAVVKNSGTTTLYVNGVSGGTTASLGNLTDAQPLIGAGRYTSSASPNAYMLGYISNFRIVKGTAVYTSAFTPSTTPLTAISGTSLLTCQSNRFIDNSTNAFTITKVGDTTISPAIPFTANSSYSTYGSTYFDGTGDYLIIPSNAVFQFGTGDFTMECWFYDAGTSDSYPGIISSANGWQSGSTALRFNNQGNRKFGFFHNPTGDPIFSSINTFSSYQWYHVAVTRSGTSLQMFVNGVQEASSTVSASISLDHNTGVFIGSGFDTSSKIKGYISNVRVVKGTAVYTTAFTPPTVPLTAIANTSLLTLQYNGGATNQGIIDNSNFNNIVTRAGNTSQGSFSPYSVTGWSNYFDGTGDYLSIPYSSAFNLTGDFTIEFWVNFGNLPTSTGVAPQSYQRLFSFGTYNAANSLGLEVNSNDGGQIRRWATWYNGGGASLSTNNAVDTNIWYHVAMVRSGTTITLYVNGISTGLTVTGASAAVNTSQAFYIGSLQGFESDTSACFKGYISNFRILKGTALYTTTFTPPTSPLTSITNTQLLTCQSNRFIDNSPNSLTLAKAGDVSVQALDPFGSVPEAVPISYSVFFDGTGDYFYSSASSANAMGTGDYTVEAWIYVTAAFGTTGSGRGAIISNRGQESAGAAFMLQHYNGKIYFGTSGTDVIVGSTTMVTNTWYHVVVSRSSGTVRLFLNGVSDATAVTGNSTNHSDTNAFYVGVDGAYDRYPFTGYISNARLVKGTAVYTSAFTPPTTPLTAISGTSLLTCQSTRIIDNSANAFTLTAAGDVKPRIFNPFGYTAQTYTSYTPSLHSGSAYFDGTGDYLRYNNTSIMTFSGSSNFTVECWVYQTAYTSTSGYMNNIIGDLTPTDATALYWSVGMNASNQPGVRWFDGTVKTADSGTALPLNTWNHVAWVVTSGVVTIFVNGIKATLTGTTTLTTPSSIGYYITGADRGTYFTGYMSDLRITKSALYTSNFVPPTAPLTNYSTSYPAQLLLNFNNGGIIDQHSSNVLETGGNAQLSTSVKKYNNGSLSFSSASTQYLFMPNKMNAFQFQGSDFTIEVWVNISDTSGRKYILGPGTDTASHFKGFGLEIWGQQLCMWASSNGSNWDLLECDTAGNRGSTLLSTGTWYHIAATRNGNVYRSFVNGTLEKTFTVSGSIYFDASIPYNIGRTAYQSGNFYYNGYMDDLRITKGYARYTSNFTAPTSALITK